MDDDAAAFLAKLGYTKGGEPIGVAIALVVTAGAMLITGSVLLAQALLKVSADGAYKLATPKPGACELCSTTAIKQLFKHMICQPTTNPRELPQLDPEDLHSVFQDISTRPTILIPTELTQIVMGAEPGDGDEYEEVVPMFMFPYHRVVCAELASTSKPLNTPEHSIA